MTEYTNYQPSKHTSDLYYPTWTRVLEHVGQDLNGRSNNVTGIEYLRDWVHSLLTNPLQPLPYLFLYGPEASGKSILHEAISLLLTKDCVCRNIYHTLTSLHGFNCELDASILCIVEEVDLSTNKRIIEFVTAQPLTIRPMYAKPYTTINKTHWIQCTNDITHCPCVDNMDLIYVKPLDEITPKNILINKLTAEAPDFVTSLEASK